jgi:DNA-binding NtrC family response regulator
LPRTGLAQVPRELPTPAHPYAGAPGSAAPAQNSLPLTHRVSAFERNLLLAALKEAKGSMDDAARILKTLARTLRHKLRQHKIDRKTFLT